MSNFSRAATLATSLALAAPAAFAQITEAPSAPAAKPALTLSFADPKLASDQTACAFRQTNPANGIVSANVLRKAGVFSLQWPGTTQPLKETFRLEAQDAGAVVVKFNDNFGAILYPDNAAAKDDEIPLLFPAEIADPATVLDEADRKKIRHNIIITLALNANPELENKMRRAAFESKPFSEEQIIAESGLTTEQIDSAIAKAQPQYAINKIATTLTQKHRKIFGLLPAEVAGLRARCDALVQQSTPSPQPAP